MKRVNAVCVTICLIALLGLSLAPIENKSWADEDGLTPTVKAAAEINPALLLNLPGKQTRAAGDTVTVSSIDSSEFPTILLTVIAQNSAGMSIHNLTLDDFIVTEQSNLEGAPTTQRIESVTPVSVNGGVSLAFVIDISSSMHSSCLSQAKQLAQALIGSMNADDRAMLISFSGPETAMVVTPSRAITTDENGNGVYDIIEQINDLTPSGKTAMYDSLATAIDRMRTESQPKAILLFTDGATNSDQTHDINDVVQMATAADIPIYPLGCIPSFDFGNIGPVLQNIADGTGGAMMENPTEEDMNAIYAAAAGGIASAYTIVYTSHNPVADGTTRTVNVIYDGASGTASYSISDMSDQSPSAHAGEAQTVGEGTQATLDASGSSTPDASDSLSFLWEQTTGPSVVLSDATSATPSFIAPQVDRNGDVLVFRVIVRNALGLAASASTQVTVEDVAPVADFSWTPARPIRNQPVQFENRTSTPGGDPIVGSSWNFGDGQISSAENPSHVFNCGGPHQVALTVTDANGTTHVMVATLNVATSDDCDENMGCFLSSAGAGNKASWKTAFLILVLAGCGLLWSFRKRIVVKRTLILALAISVGAILYGIPDSARAELRHGALTLSPMAGMYVFDHEQNIDAGPAIGLGVDYQWGDEWSTELMLTYGWHKFHYLDCDCSEDDVNALAGRLDLLYYLRPDERLVPYLAAGIGFMSVDFDRFKTWDDVFANYGGGIKYFVSENIALRADLRGVYTFDDSYNNASAMIGVSVLFGGKKRTKAPDEVVREVARKTTAPVQEETVVVEKKPATATVTAVMAPAAFQILFPFDKYNVNPALHNDLKGVADYLKADSRMQLRIEGHADEIGTHAYNRELSIKRARAVGKYLTDHFGIPESRMQFVGFGKTRPVATNATPEGRQLNRRAELKYIEVTN